MKLGQRSFIVFIILALTAGIFSSCAPGPTRGEIKIAVMEAAPLNADGSVNPHSIYAGAKMAADEVNALGGIDGYRITILPYMDDNNPAKAKENADAVLHDDAWAVIGHSSAETLEASALTFNQTGVAVVNAAPVPAQAIKQYQNIYNITYTSEQQGAYLANYARTRLNQEIAVVIYDDSASNLALAHKFKNTFAGLGGETTLEIRLPVAPSEQEITAAVSSVFTKNTGLLVIAAGKTASAQLVIALKNRGFTNMIIGGDNLSTRGFIDQVRSEPAENTNPGYYTNNIITTRTLLPDSASGFATRFIEDYQAAHPGIAVSNSASRGYDAALAIFRAIQTSERGGNTADERLKILSALAAMNDPSTQFEGVTGPIFFGRDRNIVRPVLLGMYQNSFLVSAPYQYEPIPVPENISDLAAQYEKGHIVTLNGKYAYITRIIYTGMDLIEIKDIDQKNSTYTADFYLWFRYIENAADPEFLPEEVEFTNAVNISNYSVIKKQINADGMIETTLRVSGVFKNQFSYQAYPFDRQNLLIQFRNKYADSNLLQYVIDRPGMRYETDKGLLADLVDGGVFKSLFGWKATNASAAQSYFSTTSTLGDPVNFDRATTTAFSVFDIKISLMRDSLVFIIKSLLPLLITLILAYITFYLPLGHSERLGVGSTGLLTTAFFHLNFSNTLPEIGYTVAMEYFFYASYAMSALIVLLETISVRMQSAAEDSKKKEQKAAYERKRARLNMIGKIVYPAVLLSVLGAGALTYYGFIDLNRNAKADLRPTEQLVQAMPPASFSAESVDAAPGIVTTLELASWRPEDDVQIKKLLAAFHQDHPEINLVHLPISGASYEAIMFARLGNNSGPALFFLPPFMRRYSEYAMNLNSLGIEKHFDENARFPWQDEYGKYYGLPYVGVIHGVYYNMDIFKKLNLSAPTSWEDFLTTAEALKTAGYIPLANNMPENEESEVFMTLAPNFIGGKDGRNRYNINGGRCFNDPLAVSAYQAVADLFPYFSSDFTQISSYTSKERFISGEAAMLIGGSWDVNFFSERAGFRWDVFAMPAPNGRTTTVIFQPDIAIGVNDDLSPKEKQAASTFLKWLMTEQSLNMTLDTLPGFYPLINMELKPVANEHSAQFQSLALNNPTDLRWPYSELSLENNIPQAGLTMQAAQYAMATEGISAQEAADRVQAALAQWYEPAQTCKK